MTDMPEVIYIAPKCCEDNPTWCEDDVYSNICEEGNNPTKYILSDKHEELKAIAEKMAEALQFYASTGNWVETTRHSRDGTEVYSRASNDGGAISRKALTEYNKYKGE